jgi:hypothetical protein
MDVQRPRDRGDFRDGVNRRISRGCSDVCAQRCPAAENDRLLRHGKPLVWGTVH